MSPRSRSSDGDVPPGESTAQVEADVAGRLASATFSSDLTATQYGACLELDMEPVGFVQGFCAMQFTSYGSSYWSYFGRGNSGFYRQWNCPHGFVSAEHRAWGYNAEMTINESAWLQGYSSAYNRMMQEAQEAGAHGVIGVAANVRRMVDYGVHEFNLTGTAVRVKGVESVPAPFSTYLAGQRLVKLIDAGYMPVQVVATLSEIGVYAYCLTAAMVEGRMGFAGSVPGGGFGGGSGYGGGMMGGLGGIMGGLAGGGAGRMGGFGGGFAPGASSWGGQGGAWSGGSGWAGGSWQPQEISQITEAYMTACQIANERIAHQLAGDTLHGASMSVTAHEGAEGNRIITCLLEGTRVRRFAEIEPMDPPRPVVGMWD